MEARQTKFRKIFTSHILYSLVIFCGEYKRKKVESERVERRGEGIKFLSKFLYESGV